MRWAERPPYNSGGERENDADADSQSRPTTAGNDEDAGSGDPAYSADALAYLNALIPDCRAECPSRTRVCSRSGNGNDTARYLDDRHRTLQCRPLQPLIKFMLTGRYAIRIL